MTAPQRGVMALAVVSILACLWLANNLDNGPDAERRTLPAVASPESDSGSLEAQVSSRNGTTGNTFQTEVEVTGRWNGQPVDQVVLLTQESPDMLRLGWQSPLHLVVSVPQYPQDAGKAVGAGDPSFRCGSARRSLLTVSCDSYPVGVRAQ